MIAYIMLIGLALAIDILEIIIGILDIAFIGFILNIILWVLDLLFILLFYLLTGTDFRSIRSIIILLQGLVESIPGIDVLPIRTITTIFLAITHKEQE